eukprot:TRINITY_DN1857_c0_g2_i2.p1 TRINITY_DN1857_c0_g2~~TRINITY_DN1857_c0_g2_i2.p1  ORF type:complete len:399 (-),score=83.67 TRINITY_DN1857_c0_g2_i2:3-1199(-)
MKRCTFFVRQGRGHSHLFHKFAVSSFSSSFHTTVMANKAPNLKDCLSVLEKVAPLKLADKTWDNVGLLIEPTKTKTAVIDSIYITNDLVEPVLDEIIQKKDENKEATSLIVSYHPPLFSSFKRITSADPHQKIAIRAIENNIAVYSPHSALDSVAGGINDWLAEGVGEGTALPIEPYSETLNPKQTIKVTTTLGESQFLQTVSKPLSSLPYTITNCSSESAEKVYKLEYTTNPGQLPDLLADFKIQNITAFEISNLQTVPIPGLGQGRILTLNEATSIQTIVERLKKHLNIKYMRVALGNGRKLEDPTIKKVSLCAGSGFMVIKKERNVDLWLTGELKHHEVLQATQKGVSVLICEHTHTERGFLQRLKDQLTKGFEAQGKEIKIDLSQVDADPLVTL